RTTGKSIVFITHKLREVKAVADRITVIRRGRVVGEASPQDSETELAGMMVGRDVQLVVAKDPAHPGDVSLRVSGLTIRDDRGTITVNDLNLDVHAGEIVGLAG